MNAVTRMIAVASSLAGAACIGTSARPSAVVVMAAPPRASGLRTPRVSEPSREAGLSVVTPEAGAGPADPRNGRFFAFLNLVKNQVVEHWHPEAEYRRRDPTGAVYGPGRHFTELRVELAPDGRLRNLTLLRPSGLEFLDDEAIEAFKGAQPFSHPPRQMLGEDGTARFRFGFLFDPNGSPTQRWFRYIEDGERFAYDARDAGAAD